MSLVIASATHTRSVRCLVVGEDLDLGVGSFALAVDEEMTVSQLKQHVLEKLPPNSQERLSSEMQLFKGFDLYTSTTSSQMTTPVKATRKPLSSPIDDLLKNATPEKTASKYFQRKYAMRQRASLGEYLPRGRKCEMSRIDVLVSVPKFQLSEDLEELGSESKDNCGFEYDTGIDAIEEKTACSPLKRRRDPVVEEAVSGSTSTPTKWKRMACGRVVSVASLRARCPCKECA